MRTKVMFSVLTLFLATGLLWAQFWKGYGDAERQKVGEAYWLAGKQYQVIGKTEKGGEFMSLARLIYPELDPATIADIALPSAAELLAQGRAPVLGAGAGLPTQGLNSFCFRFVGTLIDEDAAGASGFLDGSIYLTRLSAAVIRADAEAALAEFFKSVPLKGLTPSAVYDLNSVVVARASQAMQTAWGETYTLTVSAKQDYSAFVSFWDMKQQFTIHRVAGLWYILGFGQTPPPLTWAPTRTAVTAAAAPVASPEAEATRAISDAFAGCVAAMLKKNTDGAIAFMAESIRFLRLRQTVTKDELATTMQGYFDSADFGSATIADVLDQESIFVDPAESPVEGVSGTVYLLNVKAKVDLSGSIPFWSTYQKYYFVLDKGDWKIFAIL
jgi:hypothetical protein